MPNTLSNNQLKQVKNISEEYSKSFILTNKIDRKTVVFYGGSNLDKETKIYNEIQELAKKFGERDWAVITGGGFGVMKAGLIGAKNAGAKTISFRMNKVDNSTEILNDIDGIFENFAPRKAALRHGDVYIYCPGSFGTLDELMENLNLIKTEKLPIKPIYLYNTNFWSGLVTWIKTTIVEDWKLGDEKLLDLFKMVDNEDEILKDIFK
jgi:uncharacterized protein (TIGR00730 family)